MLRKPAVRDDGHLESNIADLLGDEQYAGHPLRGALDELFSRYQDELAALERLTSISDGYQTVLRQRNQSLSERYRRQIRQLQKIVRISDHYQEMLRELNTALRAASSQDPLTNLPNRRMMMERLAAEVATSARNGKTFSIASVDVDYFKVINDDFGHDVGDTALISIANCLAAELRAYDVCARWGGEEFLILLPDTSAQTAFATCERLRTVVAGIKISSLPDDFRTSVSIGIAEYVLGTGLEATIKRADQALYQAKHGGRNCIVIAPVEEARLIND